MTRDFEELGRRAVACEHWRWMPGMLLAGETPNARPLRVPDGGDPTPPSHWGAIPDLTDSATLGCLLALVREAWGDPLIHAEPEHADLWRVWTRLRPMRMVGKGATEAEALVAALEAAPAKAVEVAR